MPVTGIIPMVMPTDWNVWNSSMAKIPVHIIRWN